MIDEYLARLPQGIYSYPEMRQKASAVPAFLEGVRLTDLDGLPAEIQDVIRRPPPVSVWIPEVHCSCLFLAIRERCFSSDADYVAYLRDVNKKLLSGALYRALFAMVGPKTVVKGAADRWGKFHKGSVLDVTLGEDGKSAEVRLTSPEHLFPERIADNYAISFETAIGLASGGDAQFSMVEHTPTLAVYRGSWQ